MTASADVVVLCEDVQGWMFCRAALVAVGHTAGRVRVRPFPGRVFLGGESSPQVIDGYTVHACGAQHVVENYPLELDEIRTRASKMQAYLVVHVDVDNSPTRPRTVRDRERELGRACERAGVADRRAGDPVARLIPRREIETWIYALQGRVVNEEDEYPHMRGTESDGAPAAESFAARARAADLPVHDSLPSLDGGVKEFRRVLPRRGTRPHV